PIQRYTTVLTATDADIHYSLHDALPIWTRRLRSIRLLSMAMFAYRVARPDGSTFEGQLEGEDESLIRAKRESQGLLVFKVHRSGDRKSTRLHSSHVKSSYAVFCVNISKR